jgi:hypothetical protein
MNANKREWNDRFAYRVRSPGRMDLPVPAIRNPQSAIRNPQSAPSVP